MYGFTDQMKYMQIIYPSIKQNVAHNAAGPHHIHLPFLTKRNPVLWGAARSPLKNTHFYRHPCISLIKTEDIFKEKQHILSLLLNRNEEDKVPSTIVIAITFIMP